MTVLFAENFDYFGTGTAAITRMLQGFYASIGDVSTTGATDTYPEIPSFETSGKNWLRILARGSGYTRVLPAGPINSIGVATRIYMTALPLDVTKLTELISLYDNVNNKVVTLNVTPAGNLQVINNAGTVVAQTTVPCILSATAHKVQGEFALNATTGTAQVRVDGVAVIGGTSGIAGTNLVLPGTNIGIVGQRVSGSSFAGTGAFYSDFFVPYSLTGTYNSSFPAISKVVTLWPNSAPVDTFTPRPFRKIGAGELRSVAGGALDAGAVSNFDVGSGAFTMETFIRFTTLPQGVEERTILGKWSASTNQRSYRLVKYGPGLNNGQLRFEYTTDGTLGTRAAIVSTNWTPIIGRWYNVAVSRTGGNTRLFIDGVQQGLAIADANTYFATTTNAKFTVGGEISGTGTTVLANSSIDGRFDECRITVGVGRYTATYTPTAVAYPRTVGGDANFASVQLLFGFDTGAVDESTTSTKTLTLTNSSRELPIDGIVSYDVFNQSVPVDDRYMEAPFVAASNVFQLSGLPAAAETVVLGAKTYTWRAAVAVTANEVLIGAAPIDCLTNLTNAINGGPGSGTTYGSATTPNVNGSALLGPTASDMTVTAITAGTAGNSIATTETVANGVYTNGATMTGGLNIPTAAEYTLTPLPPQATGLRALFMIDRAFVDSDSASQRKSFVVGASVGAGTDNALTSTPTYRGDVIEQDPLTAAALTPTSVINGRVRLARTT